MRMTPRFLAFVALAAEHDLWIISDEIYEKLVYDGAEHVSPASFGEDAHAKVVTLNGFSKTCVMPQRNTHAPLQTQL